MSYTTVSAADTYFGTRSYVDAWVNSSDTVGKQKALNDAARILNQFKYVGWKTVSTQTDEWPRTGVYLNGSALDPLVIPNDLLSALYEIAYQVFTGWDIDQATQGIYVTSRKYAGVSTTYDLKQIPDFIKFGVPSYLAWMIILKYIDVSSHSGILINRTM